MKNYLSVFVLLSSPQLARGHGATEVPMSRVYGCYLTNNAAAACKAAVAAGGEQAVYDWNGVNILDAAGRHRERIPDGRLCSAGREQHKAFDLARADWPATTLLPDASGNVRFTFRGTAPHATAYFRFYLTRDGYDPSRPLAWSDLDAAPFCEPQWVLDNGRFHMTCKLPQRTGRHVLYTIWQRSDSPEAFYSCSDVDFGGGSPPPSPAWKEIGRIRALESLPVGTTVTLRVFDATGRDIETHSVILQAGQIDARDWPFTLATHVNLRSGIVKSGVAGSNGNIIPVRDALANAVYALADGYRIAVDISKPVTPSVPPGTQYLYPAGIGSYRAGTLVKGADGNIYQCRPSPFTPFCNRSDPAGVTAFSPGVGYAWREAWVFVATGTPPPPPTTAPVYPQGRESYDAGTVVQGKDGKLYRCRAFPNSGWCKGSELYYAPGTGLAWQDAWTRLN
jgi:chitin-binding protein